MIYKIRWFFKNLKEYMPVLWNDRDWDWFFLIVLLQKKLKRMEDLHRNSHITKYHTRYADQIKIAIILCDRLTKKNYSELDTLEFHKKYGESISYTTPAKNGGSYLHFTYKKCEGNPRMVEEANKKSTEIYKLEHKRRQDDIDYLFKHISKRLTGWWE